MRAAPSRCLRITMRPRWTGRPRARRRACARAATQPRRGAFALPADNDAAAMYAATAEEAARFGLLPYEVSNYAKPGAESRHNLQYWRYGDYRGRGPGARRRRAR